MESTAKTSRWEGKLNLVYRYHPDETQLAQALMQSPLKVQQSFYPEGKAICHSVILHTAGGIVGGDHLTQTIHLQSQAKALITTAAASKIYRSQGLISQQTITINIESGAILEWLPQETIVFNGAYFQQNLKVELAQNSSWLGWEITRFGRTASGERFLQGEWRSQTEIWQNNQPILIDRQWLPGGESLIDSPCGLGGKAIAASLIYIGKPISNAIIQQARSLWADNHFMGEAGVTQTQHQGLICRYRGESNAEVKQWFMAVWQLLRQHYLKRAIAKPRVWL